MHPYVYQALIADRQSYLTAEAERGRVAKRARLSRRLRRRGEVSPSGRVARSESAPSNPPVPIAVPRQRSSEDVDADAGADAGTPPSDWMYEEVLAARKTA